MVDSHNSHGAVARGLCPACGFESTDGSTVCPRDGAALIPQMVDPLIGTVVEERYRIHAVIGRGGTCVVYRAMDLNLNRAVVIKMVHEELTSEREVLARFQRGAKAASMLTHPNILALYDCVVSNSGSCYLVMEYVDGVTLADVIGYEGKVGLQRGVRVFSQVCDALAHAHGRKIVHRNLKPSNVLLAKSEDGREIVKLADFGIAKQFPAPTDAGQKITRTGQWVGSPLYMSPEQATGKEVDARSDIYSLGKVMLEAFHGKIPILADSLRPDPQLSSGEHRVLVTSSDPSAYPLPPPIQRVISRALKKDPRERYQSAKELKRDLEAIEPAARAGSGAGGPGAFIGLNLSMPAHRWLMVMILPVVVVLGAAAAWLTWTDSGRVESTKVALAIQEASLPADDPKVAETMNRLAQLYQRTGQHNEAARTFEQLLPMVERKYGAASDQLIETQLNLAQAYVASGNKEKAKERLKQSLAIIERRVAQIQRDPSKPMIGVGQVMPLMERSKALAEQVLEAGNQDMVRLLNGLASAYMHCGQYDQAESCLKRALALGGQGDELSRVFTPFQLGRVYTFLGKFNLAEVAYKRALTEAVKAYGPHDAYTTNVYLGLGDLYLSRGNPAGAVSYFKQVLGTAACDTPQGADFIAHSLQGLCDAYIRLGKYREAESTALRLLDFNHQARGDRTDVKPGALCFLGVAYVEQGKAAKAEQSFAAVQQIEGKKFTPQELMAGAGCCDGHMAQFYFKHGKYGQAEIFFRRAVARLNSSRVPLIEQTAVTLIRLGQCEAGQGKKDQAIATYGRAMEIEAHNADLSRKYLAAHTTLVATYLRSIGRAADADKRESLTRDVLAKLK